jgi:hypothetical protein
MMIEERGVGGEIGCWGDVVTFFDLFICLFIHTHLS